MGSTRPALFNSSTCDAFAVNVAKASVANQADSAVPSDRSSGTSQTPVERPCGRCMGVPVWRDSPITGTSRDSNSLAKAQPRPRLWPVTMATIMGKLLRRS